jgi:DNA-binding transcriptional LysR family regulator
MLRSRLDDVSVRHLRALVAVFEEGTFQRAADRLGFSQAAISQQIGALEKAVGAPLFDRFGGPRPVRLTPTGDLILTHAKIVLGQLEVADRELTDLQSGRAARLRVGTFQSVSVRLLPSIITELRCQAPDLDMAARVRRCGGPAGSSHRR